MPDFQRSRDLPRCLQPAKAGADWRPPIDTNDLATRLETEGITDSVARRDFAFDSSFQMANAWLPTIRNFEPPSETVGTAKPAWRDYWNGISFAVPLVCSCVSILLLGFSLWGGALTADEATAVGLGAIGSFLISGGPVQIMARRSLFFIGTEQHRRCEQWTWFCVRWSATALISVVLGVLAASTYWSWLPARLNLVAAAFCVSLGLFWLATGILHFLNRAVSIVWITLGGVAMVVILHRAAGTPLLVAQLMAILLSAGAGFALSKRLLERGREEAPTGPLPSPVRDLFFLWPYFLYGTLYYLLLFGDRLLAWTSDTHATGLAVQFRGDYETALNLGLLAFVFQVGWVHHSTAGFYFRVAKLQREFSIDRAQHFRDLMVRFYWERIAWLAPLAAVSSAMSLLAATVVDAPGRNVDMSTFGWSLAGIPFLVAGLWNVSLLFGLSNASKAAAAAGLACLVNIAAGYTLSRVAGYHYAVIGFAAGTAVFAALSGRWSLRAFRRLDYYYFAASA